MMPWSPAPWSSLEGAVVEPLCDIGELLPDRDEGVVRLVVEALGRVVVPNVCP